MSSANTSQSVAQLVMPGMPKPDYQWVIVSCQNAHPGQEVRYVGRVGGGPRYGSCGVIVQALDRRAIVDMGQSGTWYIPYYFLATSLATS